MNAVFAMTICYKFIRDDQLVAEFQVDPARKGSFPVSTDSDWVRLETHQCPHCPLTGDYCPIAVDLAVVVEKFKDKVSYDLVNLSVTNEFRTTTHQCSFQRALSSLIGLIMASSECPYTRFLRPIAKHHLPLASDIEQLIRVLGNHFISHFIKQDYIQVNDLTGLHENYSNLHIVNVHIARRLQLACEEDASINALVHLDLITKHVGANIEDNFEDIKDLFDL